MLVKDHIISMFPENFGSIADSSDIECSNEYKLELIYKRSIKTSIINTAEYET